MTCQQCHGDGVYHGKNTTCVSCHQADYDATTDPNHRTADFPTDCTECHTTATWVGADFNHSATAFPLTGAHPAVTCQQCHGDGVYAGKSTACVACHQGDYDGTTDPTHRTAHFPTDCTDCHTTTTWKGATFDHDARFFPIYSGSHRGEVGLVHHVPHQHRELPLVHLPLLPRAQPERDGQPARGRSGYRYDSQACYSCHPRGKADETRLPYGGPRVGLAVAPARRPRTRPATRPVTLTYLTTTTAYMMAGRRTACTRAIRCA